MDAKALVMDLFWCMKYVVKIYNHLMKGKYQFHNKDEMSVNLWYRKHQDDSFFY